MEEGRIVGVEPMGYEPPSDCQLVDYGNATVLPGLIDTHVHLVGNSGVMALERVAGYSPEEIDEVVSESLRRQLAAGVTTVRDLGDRHFSVVERRDAQRQVDDRLQVATTGARVARGSREHRESRLPCVVHGT